MEKPELVVNVAVQAELKDLAAEAVENAVGAAYGRGYERARRDATEWLDARLNKMANALRVITGDPHIRGFLITDDPQALRQAEEALR